MARKKTGSLVEKVSGWFARVWVALPDGTPERRFINLETKDRAIAKRKLAKLVRMIAEGTAVADVKEAAREAETISEYALAWVERRKASGVVMAKDEKNNLVSHILPEIGKLVLTDFRPVHGRTVLANAVAKDLSRETVKKIRGVMNRVFDHAFKAELIVENPMLRVGMPTDVRDDERDRVILSDEEIALFLASPKVDLELKVLSFVARVEGGMRTAELNRWDWSMLDAPAFGSCRILRAKTGKIQDLTVPEVLRPILHAWWSQQGCPAGGAVFPSRRGKNKGGFKISRGSSYAKRLRVALQRAGVRRHICVRPADAKKQKANEACCVNLVRDALFNDTPVSRQVDFHSFRRAFNTALAEAGVNVQTAMHLASHSDAKVHGKYVMKTKALQLIPAGAVPQIEASALWFQKVPAGAQSPKSIEKLILENTPILSGELTQAGATNDVFAEKTASGAVGQRFESSVAR